MIGEDGREVRIPVRISMDDPEPMYRQVEDQLKELILNGQLPAGTQLPSVRALAQELACSVITTRRAYQDLEGEGFLRTRQGMGTVVAKIALEERSRYRRDAVLGSFREAVRAGLRVDCTPEEMREIFESVLEEERREDNDDPGEEAHG